MIVNADSAQIYRDLPILSAAPGPDERARAEHRLYGVLDGAQACSAADWAEMAQREIADIHASAGRCRSWSAAPDFTCGPCSTGLHRSRPSIRMSARRCAKLRSRTIRESLQELDPEAAARLNPADTTRIARALEVVLSTGKTLARVAERA